MAENVVLQIGADDKASGVISNLAKRLTELISSTRGADDMAKQLTKTMQGANDVMSTGETRAQMVARQYRETQSAMSGATKAIEEGTKATDKLANSQTNLGKSLVGGALKFAAAFAGISLGVQAVINTIKESVAVAKEYQLQLIGLNTITSNFGINQTQVSEAVKTLTADGLLTQQQAVSGLTSLFSSYITNVDDAVLLMTRFKDLAASGGKASYDFGTKVDNLAESFLTEMSMLGNNSGMQENWNQIIKVGEQVTGKKAEAVDYLTRQQIKLAGVMEIAKRAEGAAVELTKTHVGAMQMAATGFNNLKLELGNALIPALGQLASAFVGSSATSQVLIQALRAVGVMALGLVATLRLLAGTIATVFNTVGSYFAFGADAAKQAWAEGTGEILDTANSLADSMSKVWKGEIGPEIQGVFGSIPDWATEAGDKATKAYKKMLEEIKKENEKYQREMEKRNDEFLRSLNDMVKEHQSKVSEITKQLKDETASFEAENAKRVADYEASLLKMQKAYERKVRNYNQDVQDENEDYANTVSDILAQIAEEEKKGYMLFGVWNSAADQDRLAQLRSRLDEEDVLHKKRLAELQQDLADETEDYQTSLAEKKTTYEEETATAKAEYDQRVADLRASLDEELNILNAHKDEVAMVKDMAVEDDIARLVRQHQEEAAEAERAHSERIAEIKEQASEQGATFGSNYANSAGEGINKWLEDYKKQLASASEDAKVEGGNAGKGWLQELFRKGAEEAQAARERIQKAGANLPSFLGDLLKAFEALGHGAAHGGLVPGAMDQPVLMTVHGGERVVPRTGVDVNNSGGIGGGLTINMYGEVSMRSDNDIKLLADEIIQQIGRRNELERLGVGM